MAPKKVHSDFKKASWFIFVAVACGIFKVYSIYTDESLQELNSAIRLGLSLLLLGIFVWLAIMIAKGKEWARITFTVMAASLLIFTPLFIFHEFDISVLIGSLTTIFLMCLFVAVLLLYTKSARLHSG